MRRRPTLPHTFAYSTIGPAGLNFRVRDGNGWNPRGKITAKSSALRAEPLVFGSWYLAQFIREGQIVRTLEESQVPMANYQQPNFIDARHQSGSTGVTPRNGPSTTVKLFQRAGGRCLTTE